MSPGKGRAGFTALPSGEPPALVAARKSRQHKNRRIVKVVDWSGWDRLTLVPRLGGSCWQ